MTDSTQLSLTSLKSSLGKEIEKVVIRHEPPSQLDSVLDLKDGKTVMEGLVIECPPLEKMKAGTCVYGYKECLKAVPRSEHVMLCSEHYELVIKKHCGENYLQTTFASDYNQQVYDNILPCINQGLHRLMTLKKFDSHEKELYKALAYIKAFILIYRRYLNPGYEALMNIVLNTLGQYLGQLEVRRVIPLIVSILACFGIVLVARDLGLEIPLGLGMAVGGGLAVGIGVGAPTMFGLAIAAAPALPIIIGGTVCAIGVGLIFKGIQNWNVPPPPRNQWCRIAIWLYT